MEQQNTQELFVPVVDIVMCPIDSIFGFSCDLKCVCMLAHFYGLNVKCPLQDNVF